jgi:Zn-dependent peptidase ImmA (M78 family)/transcriptional regulator with XRE-family HTH domain
MAHMERIQSVNAARIAWCCADHGITPRELAAALSISPDTMSSIMAGELGPSFQQLSKIAQHFGRGVLFFLEPGPVDAGTVHTPQFRTLTSQKPELSARLKALIERVERQRDVFLSLREDLDTDSLPLFRPPDLQGCEPKPAAHLARAWLKLGQGPQTFESYRQAVEARGILVFRASGYAGKWQIAKESPILGFALYDDNCPVIVVKKQHTDTQLSFTLMHELGHLLLHKASSIDDDTDMHAQHSAEREANAFAGHLLVPSTALTTVDDSTRPHEVFELDVWLKALRKQLAVSTEVILRRLMDEGRLNVGVYAAYRQWRAAQPAPEEDGGSRKWRPREPKHLFGDRYVRTVLDALDSRHITLAKASDCLDSLKIKDIRELERFYAGS